MLEISKESNPVKREDIIKGNVYLMRSYLNKTDLTLLRDLEVAINMGLIRKVEGKYEACKEKILSFLPPKKNVST